MTEEVSKELFAKAEMALDCGQVMDGVDPRDILRLRPPTGSYASFEDWFHELEGFSLRSERAEGDIAWLRAAFDAGRSPTEARGEPVANVFEFDRYINGQLMAEGVTIERCSNLKSAMSAAAKIASRGPRGEQPVLICTSHPPAREAVDDAMIERARIAVTDALDTHGEFAHEAIARAAILAALQVKP